MAFVRTATTALLLLIAERSALSLRAQESASYFPPPESRGGWRAMERDEDIRAVAGPVLRHRIITNFNAEAEGIKSDDIITKLAELIPVDEMAGKQSGQLPKIFKSGHAG